MWSQFNDTITESCRQNFWPTVLFYNNFNYNVETVCNFPTVFVSLIFQLKIVALVIITLLSKLSQRRLFVMISFLLISAIGLNIFLRFYFNILIPQEYARMTTFTELKFSVMFFNFNPLTYLATLIFGIGAGYLLKYQIKFRHLHVHLFGIGSFILFIFGIVYMERLDMRQKFLGYYTISTIAGWGRMPMLAFICWVVYASEERHMGKFHYQQRKRYLRYSNIVFFLVMTKRFLSSVVWYPLCQLSYGFFISSLIVNSYRLFSIQENITLAPPVMFRAIVSDAVIAFFFSYLIHVFVLQPMKNLRYILIRCPISLFGCEIGNSSYQCSDITNTLKRPKELRFCTVSDMSTCSSPTNSDVQNNNALNDEDNCQL